jgi:hypothetical protein
MLSALTGGGCAVRSGGLDSRGRGRGLFVLRGFDDMSAFNAYGGEGTISLLCFLSDGWMDQLAPFFLGASEHAFLMINR